MNKTDLNYTAPEVEIISIETQNCIASSSGPMPSPARFGITSDCGLDALEEDSTDWN